MPEEMFKAKCGVAQSDSQAMLEPAMALLMGVAGVLLVLWEVGAAKANHFPEFLS